MLLSDPYTISRFWSKVAVGTRTECWPWTGTMHYDRGYGHFSIKRRWYRAHRLALEFWGVPVGPDDVVMHRCDNPPCCNPHHLAIGTHGDNVRDAAGKGRLRPGLGRAKLTVEKVLEIRRRRAAGEAAADLALEFDVSRSTISEITRRRRWSKI